MSRFTDIKYMDTTWFEMWKSDRLSIIETMLKNVHADLECGYNYFGNCIQNQLKSIKAFQDEFNATLDMFTEFNDDSKIERYCYHDLIKHGVIE